MGWVRSFALAAALTVAAPAAADRPAPAGKWSAMLFGGWFFDNKWSDFVIRPGRVQAVESWILGGAVSREIGRWPEGLQWEIEGQLVRHFGEQDHWEVNAPIIARWTEFPWSDTVETGLAFGIGPSYALDEPTAEAEFNGGSNRLLLYWTIEASLGAPDSPWSLVGRLHHRSNAYGLFAEKGGSNILAIGLRRRF